MVSRGEEVPPEPNGRQGFPPRLELTRVRRSDRAVPLENRVPGGEWRS